MTLALKISIVAVVTGLFVALAAYSYEHRGDYDPRTYGYHFKGDIIEDAQVNRLPVQTVKYRPAKEVKLWRAKSEMELAQAYRDTFAPDWKEKP